MISRSSGSRDREHGGDNGADQRARRVTQPRSHGACHHVRRCGDEESINSTPIKIVSLWKIISSLATQTEPRSSGTAPPAVHAGSLRVDVSAVMRSR